MSEERFKQQERAKAKAERIAMQEEAAEAAQHILETAAKYEEKMIFRSMYGFVDHYVRRGLVPERFKDALYELGCHQYNRMDNSTFEQISRDLNKDIAFICDGQLVRLVYSIFNPAMLVWDFTKNEFDESSITCTTYQQPTNIDYADSNHYEELLHNKHAVWQ